jgi:hypothetical protein
MEEGDGEGEVAAEVKEGEGREGGEGGEGDGEVIVPLGVNPMHAARGKAIPNATQTVAPTAARTRWNKLKLATRASRTFRNVGKQRMKRLSTVMKARRNDSSGSGGGGNTMDDGEAKTVLEVEAAVSMHVDEKSGRRYRYNEATGHTQWLSDDDEEDEEDEEDEATIELHVENTQRNEKKTLFRKFVDGNDDVFYENMETGEVVWKMPEDGELMD